MTRTQFDDTLVDSAFAETNARTAPDADSPLDDAGRQAEESVGQIAGRAADIGLQRADQGMNQAAHTISRLAGGMRRVSTDLEVEQPAVAGAARTAAEQAERLAAYMERTDAREMVHTVEDAARRQPLLFLGGAFALGLVAARILKAGGGSSDDRKAYRGSNGARTMPGSTFGRTSDRSARGS
jgi:hypothetical protein